MIKYIIIPERRMVKAILENTEYDAYNKIAKMLRDTPFCAVSKKYRIVIINLKTEVICCYCKHRQQEAQAL